MEANTIEVLSYGNVVTIVNTNFVPVQFVEITDMTGRLVWRGNFEKLFL